MKNSSSRFGVPRPFLKWVGGKTQLINELLKRTPPSFNRYYEPFVGGGALFFRLYQEKRLKTATLNDLNQELIDTYTAIRDDCEAVIQLLQTYAYNKEFFYQLRPQQPHELAPVARAARMIYLNKTCYNGLYRVNRKGEFNVPFGSYKTPNYCDAENLRAVSRALRHVTLTCVSFEKTRKARKGDLVYFDPPYEPLSATSNFTSYHKAGFFQSDQAKLRDLCVALSDKDVYVMLSNSSAELIRTLYDRAGFFIHEVKAIRAINSDPGKRGKLTELIVTNYPVDIPETTDAKTKTLKFRNRRIS
jgi:DNA adenine methylase